MSSRIILDYVLLSNRRLVQLLARRSALESAREARLVQLEPGKLRSLVHLGQRRQQFLDLPTLLPNLDLVARAQDQARDIVSLAVDEHVAVTDDLPGLRPGEREPEALDDVVEPRLEKAKHLLARAAFPTRSVEVVLLELPLEYAVDPPNFLLLAESDGVFTELDARLPVLSGRIGSTRIRALLGVAALAFEEELHPLAAA